jgi:asparagine synthase (glutamine-hydrolysing)
MKGMVPDAILLERRKGLQAADWRFGFDAAVPSFTRELDSIKASALARQCLDLPRIQRLLDGWPGVNNQGQEMRNSYRLAVSRGIAAGHFIRRIEGGNK